MAYDKKTIDEAKKRGMFEDNSFDPKVLQLSQDEKEKMQKELNKAQQSLEGDAAKEQDAQTVIRRDDKRQRSILDVELTFFEKLIVLVLSIFGQKSSDKFKINKLIKIVGKEIAKIKPQIFSNSNKRVTKFFAFKIYDVYLKIVTFKKIFDATLDNKAKWDSPTVSKTGLEVFFERLAGLDPEEINSKFSEEGLNKLIADYDNMKMAMDAIDKSLFSYLYSIDKNVIESVNTAYSNVIYFKKLADYDFYNFLKRFDIAFNPAIPPKFNDIPGEALVSYLKDIEENILHIDLSMDNVFVFKVLKAVGKEMEDSKDSKENPESPEALKEASEVEDKKIETDLLLLFEILREIMMKKYLTLLIQMIKQDPLYTPSIVHSKFDLFKIYSDTLEKRVKNSVKKIIKDKRIKKISSIIRRVFPELAWVGIYTASLSDKLESNGYLGFTYSYQIGVMNSFITNYYEDVIKNVLNIILLNGAFMEMHFKKNVSETFYNMDKFLEDFKDFTTDISAEGASGKKFLNFIAQKDGQTHSDYRKIIERNIINMNGRANDLYDKFYSLFLSMLDIINKVYIDIDAKPPKNIRNIRGIGGFKNSVFLNYVEKSNNVLTSIKELMVLLKEN